MSSTLLAQLKKRRERSVDLGDGLSVQFLRPAEAEFPSMLATTDGGQATWSVGIEQVKRCVTGWKGFTEASLLGGAIGSSDPLDFDAEVWAEVCADRIEWNQKIAKAILDSVIDHLTKRDETAKNSEPG